jgi:hypothetical protein
MTRIWCQGKLQKFVIEVDIHGRWVSEGHRQAGRRRRIRLISVVL